MFIKGSIYFSRFVRSVSMIGTTPDAQSAQLTFTFFLKLFIEKANFNGLQSTGYKHSWMRTKP